MENKIQKAFTDSIKAKNAFIECGIKDVQILAKSMIDVLKSGNKILIFGNGGSASDSMHIAAELVGRFKKNRQALPAISLNTNISSITAIANDFGYEHIFSRQIEAIGKTNDIAIGISTSGNSINVINGIKKAKEMGLKTAVLLGKNKTELSEMSDISLFVNAEDTARVQEVHITIGHIVCELIEDEIC